MTSIHSAQSQVADKLYGAFEQGFQKAGELGQRTIELLKNLPKHMQANQNVALGVFLVANNFFFFGINAIANRLEKYFENPGQPLSMTKKIFKQIFLNGIVVGGATVGFNLLLAKLTQYSLSHFLIAAITATVVALRVMLGSKSALPSSANSAELEKIKNILAQKEKDLLEKEIALKEKAEELDQSPEAQDRKMKKAKKAASSLIRKWHERHWRKLTKFMRGETISVNSKPTSLYEIEITHVDDKGGKIVKKFNKDNIELWRNHPDFQSWCDKHTGKMGELAKKDIEKNKKIELENEDIPPPPPSMDGDAPPPPPIETAEKYFLKEPTEVPNVPPLPTADMDLFTLNAHYNIIKTFTENLEKAIKPISDLINKTVQDQQLVISEKIQAKKNAEKEKMEMLQKLKLMKSSDSYGHLGLKTSAEMQKILFCNDPKTVNAQEKITKHNAQEKITKIDVSVLAKSKYIDPQRKLAIDATKRLKTAEAELQAEEGKLKALKEANNGIPYDEFENLLKVKLAKLTKWKGIQSKYKTKIDSLEKVGVSSKSVDGEPKQTDGRDSFIAFMDQLKTSDPELANWIAVNYQDYQVAMFVRNLVKAAGALGNKIEDILAQLRVVSPIKITKEDEAEIDDLIKKHDAVAKPAAEGEVVAKPAAEKGEVNKKESVVVKPADTEDDEDVAAHEFD